MGWCATRPFRLQPALLRVYSYPTLTLRYQSTDCRGVTRAPNPCSKAARHSAHDTPPQFRASRRKARACVRTRSATPCLRKLVATQALLPVAPSGRRGPANDKTGQGKTPARPSPAHPTPQTGSVTPIGSHTWAVVWPRIRPIRASHNPVMICLRMCFRHAICSPFHPETLPLEVDRFQAGRLDSRIMQRSDDKIWADVVWDSAG